MSHSPAIRERANEGMAVSAYEAIFDYFLLREIPADARLTVDQLARELGISQTPIRQALAVLETEGLVRKHHLSGYRASSLLTRRELEDLFVVRLRLEPHAARLTAEVHDENAVKIMRSLEREMAELADQPGTMPYSIFARLDGELHNTIAAASANGPLRDSVQRLHPHVHLFRLRFDGAVTKEALGEHEEIVSAIEDQDGTAASAAMRRHLRRSLTRFRRAFDEKNA